jgi:hypothetical protein
VRTGRYIRGRAGRSQPAGERTLQPFWSRASGAAAAVVLVAVLAPHPALATAFHVHARTEAQAYQLRAWRGGGPDDPVLLPRRRIVQYLGLDAFELVTGQDLGFESNLRVYSDFGLPRGEAARLDGLHSEDVDLLYAHVRYRQGGFDARAGRQFFIDTAEIFSFDGARVRYLHRLGVGAEAYGGLWVKGASLLGSATHALDGTRDTGGRAVDSTYGVDALLAEQQGVEPVFGARLLVENPQGFGVSASAGYRRSMLAGKVNSERLGGEVRYGRGRGINAMSAVEYDLILGRASTFRALGRYDGELFSTQLEALRFAPTFSSYSIWYYFASAPRDEVRLRGDYFPVGPLRYHAQVLYSHHRSNVNEALALAAFVNEASTPVQVGAGGGAQLLLRQFRSGLDLTWRNGYGGRQLWVDLTSGFTGGDGRWSLDARGSVASVRDGFNPLLQGNFYGAQVWGSYQLTRAARASLVLEQNVNPFTRSDTKAFFVFDLKAVL